MECLPNRLTPLYSEIHYEEENYLKVRTVVFKYITTSRTHVPTFRTSARTEFRHVTQLPLVPWLHWFHQSRVLHTDPKPIQVSS